MVVRRGPSGRGFTILEILIAIVILVLGISGIIALFPTAIESGNQTVQDSYAAAFTQSVVDAISTGMRESRYRVADNSSPARVWTYFILDHDGVFDKMVPSPQAYTTDVNISQSDWCILLPQGKDGNVDPAQEPWFLYPTVPDRVVEGVDPSGAVRLPGPPDNRTQSNLKSLTDNPASGDNWSPTFIKNDLRGEKQLWVRRVFQLGRYRKDQQPAGFPVAGIRDEFLGQPVGATTASGGERIAFDPYPQYSFAIAMRRAKIDNKGETSTGEPDGKISAVDSFSSNLYEVHIFIFRSFDGTLGTQTNISSGGPIPRTNVPIREFVTFMSL